MPPCMLNYNKCPRCSLQACTTVTERPETCTSELDQGCVPKSRGAAAFSCRQLPSGLGGNTQLPSSPSMWGSGHHHHRDSEAEGVGWWAEACDMSGYNLGWWGSELPGPHSSQGILAQTAATATQLQRPGQHPTDTQREWVLRRPQWKPRPVPRSLFCGPYRHVQPAGPCIQSPPCPPNSL